MQLLELPERSVTVQITEFVPTGKLLGALLVTLATPQLSETIGVPNATPLAEHWPGPVPVETLAGQLIVGGWVSLTVTEKLQVVIPQELEAVTVTVVRPTLKTVPGFFE